MIALIERDRFYEHPGLTEANHLARLWNRKLIFRVNYDVQLTSQHVDKSEGPCHFIALDILPEFVEQLLQLRKFFLKRTAMGKTIFRLL